MYAFHQIKSQNKSKKIVLAEEPLCLIFCYAMQCKSNVFSIALFTMHVVAKQKIMILMFMIILKSSCLISCM